MTGDWAEALLGSALPAEGRQVELRGRALAMRAGILRDLAVADAAQAQTRDAFAFKWGKRDTYASPAMQRAIGDWLHERYGDLLATLGPQDRLPLLLDAGCGAGNAAALMFEHRWPQMRYVGADISDAVNIAADTIRAQAADTLFLQADLMHLPFRDGAFDIVLSEGVLHHTPSTHAAILATARLVRPGGLYAIYVYARKAPAREFTDDHIRALVSECSPQEAWDRLMPLTRLGKALGELGATIEVEEDIDVLGIPKGPVDVQRLFYWYVCKAFYRPDLGLQEMNHINFDWFTPKYSHRQTPDEVHAWCAEAGLAVERMKVEPAGITVIARRPVD